MLRENMVGTILDVNATRLDGSGVIGSVLLTGFAGEGAEMVVYSIAPLDDPHNGHQVVKFPKSHPFLHMETLHHKFTVHAELYPDHPLLMSADERLARLTTEMITKITRGHLMLQVEFYRELVDQLIAFLATRFAEAAAAGETVSLDTLPQRGWLDGHVVHRATEFLNEDLIIETFSPHVERMVTELARCIGRWQREGTYHPVSDSPLVGLVGLVLDGYISSDEMHHIALSAEFGALLTPPHRQGLLDLIIAAFHQLHPRGKTLTDSANSVVSTMLDACALLEKIGATSPRHVASAQTWRARLLMLQNIPVDVVDPLLHAALTAWSDLGETDEIHDVLTDLAQVHAPTDRAKAAAYLARAKRLIQR